MKRWKIPKKYKQFAIWIAVNIVDQVDGGDDLGNCCINTYTIQVRNTGNLEHMYSTFCHEKKHMRDLLLGNLQPGKKISNEIHTDLHGLLDMQYEESVEF